MRRQTTLIGIAYGIVLAACLAVVGCKATLAPVNNINSARVSAAMQAYTAEDVGKAIMRGLALKKWTVESHQPGEILASVGVGPHHTQIRITYDDRRYSIVHVNSSPSLQYDGKIIHRRYNHWIRLLNDSIQNQRAAN